MSIAKKISIKFLVSLILVQTSFGLQVGYAATVNPSSGHGYAQFSVNQEPIDHGWTQLNSTVVKEQAALSFTFQFPAIANSSTNAKTATVAFTGSRNNTLPTSFLLGQLKIPITAWIRS